MSEMRTIKNVKEILRDTNNNVKICKECQSMRALDYVNQTNSLFLFFFCFLVSWNFGRALVE